MEFWPELCNRLGKSCFNTGSRRCGGLPARWSCSKDVFPKLLGRRQGDFSVLQEVPPLPKLRTANAFMPQRIHEIRRGGAGEAVLASSEGRIISWMKLKAESRYSRGDPGIHPAIRFASVSGWMRPDQGVGQATAM
jgi:hypothetical protein